MLSPNPLLISQSETHSGSALVIIPSSPDSEGWRRAILAEGQGSGIAISTWENEAVDPTNAYSIHISDNLNDLSTNAYTEKTVILTQADALGHWTGRQRADVSLALSVLPTSPSVRYITPSTLDGAKSVAVTSFLNVPLDGTFDSKEGPVDHALTLYREGPLKPGAIYSWLPSDFSIDPAHQSLDASVGTRIDLTGRARCLVHGPYVALPKGQWQATVRFSVDASACRHRLRFEWGPLAQFASFEASPGKSGHFIAQITHIFEEAALCELRVILPESSLAGALTLEGVDIEMMGETAPA
ncbi:conserved hypothetical protein [Brevundimonas sp. G8]|nr:conserved hypothetical protein [Brevundimonas sp. G8]